MHLHPPKSTLTDPLSPCTTLFPSASNSPCVPTGFPHEVRHVCFPRQNYHDRSFVRPLSMAAPRLPAGRFAAPAGNAAPRRRPVLHAVAELAHARTGRFNRRGPRSRPRPRRPAHPHLCLRSEEHTSELQSLMRISNAVFCLKKKKKKNTYKNHYETSIKAKQDKQITQVTIQHGLISGPKDTVSETNHTDRNYVPSTVSN